MNILIAEDDTATRRVLETAVAQLGHTVRSAIDGMGAWELFQQMPPDIIISDWMMPEMDGLGLLRRVRGYEAGTTTYTSFLFATALTDREHLADAMTEGADDYLTKPIDLSELRIRLEVARRVMALQRQLETQKLELEVEKDRLSQRIRRLESELKRLEERETIPHRS